ncbi:MAG TPA: hypothetical protein VIG24_13915 [Acidimicrobiia bacterium]
MKNSANTSDTSATDTDASDGPEWPHGLTTQAVKSRQRLLSSIGKKDLTLIIATSMDRETFADLCTRWGLL